MSPIITPTMAICRYPSCGLSLSDDCRRSGSHQVSTLVSLISSQVSSSKMLPGYRYAWSNDLRVPTRAVNLTQVEAIARVNDVHPQGFGPFQDQASQPRTKGEKYHRDQKKAKLTLFVFELVFANSWLSQYPKTINLILTIFLSLFSIHAERVHRFFFSFFFRVNVCHWTFFQRHCSRLSR